MGFEVPTLVGVDGCRAGWVAVVESRGNVSAFVVRNVQELVERLDKDALIALDIPIGLTETGPRECDYAARKLLGSPRSSSVFSAPNRQVVVATTYRDACQARLAIDGKSVSKQAFAIYPKIREVDELLRANPGLQSRVREVHPEVSFAHWNGRKAIAASKKSREGAAEREWLIDAIWQNRRAEIWALLPRRDVGRDDLNDAFAALWTARRIADGKAILHPMEVPLDSQGLRMEIVA